MLYVEWLRVRNVMRGLAIALGVLILIAVILRVSFNSEISFDTDFIRHVQMQPGSKVSQSVLPDGTKRTTIVSASGKTHITIDDTGGGGRHVVVTEPSEENNHFERSTIGSVHVSESTNGKTETVVLDTNGATPFIFYMIVADLMAFIISTLLAAPFARENDGHLEIALTKPISRTAYGIGAIGVDLAGIVACAVMTVVAVIICQAMFEVPHFDFSGINSQAVLMGLAFPFAWYAMLNACTASLSRGYGAILGFAWPVAALVAVFGAMTWGDSFLGQAVHKIFWVVSRIDPLSYASFQISEDHATGQLITTNGNFALRFAIELILFAVYSVLAVVQWRRVEA